MKESDFNSLLFSINEAGKIRKGTLKPSRVFLRHYSHNDFWFVEKMWQKEAESRLKGYKTGKIKAIPLQQAFSKYLKAEAV